jgi:hypothetical protein
MCSKCWTFNANGSFFGGEISRCGDKNEIHCELYRKGFSGGEKKHKSGQILREKKKGLEIAFCFLHNEFM